MKILEKDFYEKTKNWDFSKFEIESEKLTNWDLYENIKKVCNKNSKILDLGTGGGEKLLKNYPDVKEILGTDYSKQMIKTAKKNLILSKRKNISFKIMDNLKMNVPKNYYDVIVARNTVTSPKQIYDSLKNGGYLFIRGVDKYDCYELKLIFGKKNEHPKKPISINDYENVLSAGFKDVELVPIHEREYFKNKKIFKNFLLKVPIINDFDDEKIIQSNEIDDEKLDKYIARNTYNGKIRLIRRYYGIVARK